jgi:RNA polymerase-binding transcription factor DksA
MYLEMTFKDWFKIVKELYDNNTYETELNHDKKVYSDKELKEFEIHIGKKIIEARNELTKLKLEVKTDKNILIRQRKYIEKLEEALTRVKNKTYGICSVTGKLIAKERLIAVPHTTLSMKAKIQQYNKK